MEGKYTRTRKYRLKRKKRFVSCIVIILITLISAIHVLGGKSSKGFEGRTSIKIDIDGKKNLVEQKDEENITNVSKVNYLILVNKKNNIGKSFVPENLKVPDVKFLSSSNKLSRRMESKAAGALEDMFEAAKKQGVNLLAVSGYRSYSYQQGLYKSKILKVGKTEADKYVAPPGGSEHQTGLAMDIISDEYTSVDEGFCKTKAYEWFKNNAYKHGFIIRYPKGKEGITTYNFEPWHLRYVGNEAAGKIMESGLTLEEYIESTKTI